MAPGFEVLDEAEAQTLLRAAQDEQIDALARADAPAELAAALAAVANRISIGEYPELMAKLLSRAGLAAGPHRRCSRPAARCGRALQRRWAARRTIRRRPARRGLSRSAHSMPQACAPRPGAGQGRQDRTWTAPALIADWLAATGPRRRSCLPMPRNSSPPRARSWRVCATKAAIAAMPGIERCLRGEAERLAASARPRQRRGAGRTHPGAAAARPRHRRAAIARAKRRRAALDYDDLIVATRRLLESAGSAAWVLYKLDGGIDHVLVDEAQDTNPDQWEVIRRLTEEFFAGEGAVERSRTVFAVGDTKQSIFGFQRADPRKLKEMREWFAEQSRIAEQGLRAGRPQRLVPLDARRARRGRLGVRRGRGGARRRRAGRRDPSAQPQGRARPGRAVAAGQCARSRDRHDRPRRLHAARWRCRTSASPA